MKIGESFLFSSNTKKMFFFSWTAPFQMIVWEEKKCTRLMNLTVSHWVGLILYAHFVHCSAEKKHNRQEKINLYRLIYWSGKVIKNHCRHYEWNNSLHWFAHKIIIQLSSSRSSAHIIYKHLESIRRLIHTKSEMC